MESRQERMEVKTGGNFFVSDKELGPKDPAMNTKNCKCGDQSKRARRVGDGVQREWDILLSDCGSGSVSE